MLRELKLPRKSPAILPKKSPILYIKSMIILVQTGPREVFFANVKLGNNINVTKKLKQMKSG